MKSNTIKRLKISSKEEIKKLSNICALAFNNNVFFRLLVPDEIKRKNKLNYLFEFLINYGLKFGEVYNSADLNSVMIFMREKHVKMSLWNQIRCGGLKTAFKLGKNFIINQDKISNILNEKHEKLINSPHIYLNILAVHPEYQKKGLSSKLMKIVFEKADSKNLPIYLETSMKKNVPLYEHFGFKLLDIAPIPETDFIYWCMLRKND